LKSILKNELLYINILFALLFLVIALVPSNIVRLVLGLPAVLFFPGYTLVAALFPRKSGVSGAERAILGVGLSIAVIPLIGLALNYMPWGLRLYPIMISLALFIMAASVVAFIRRQELPPDERFKVSVNLTSLKWLGIKQADKALNIVLALAMFSALAVLIYAAVTPKEESFTEFYILGINGEASGYPEVLESGEEGKVILGIVNQEQETTSYQLEVRIDGEKESVVGPLLLKQAEKWEEIVSFTPDRVGDREKVEFILYKNGQIEPYLKLHLWLNVKNKTP